jgi:hypothetical protein
MNIVSLEDFGPKNFITEIQKFKNFNDANSKWFDVNHKDSIINTLDQYIYWTILTDTHEKIVAFAAVDDHKFKKYNCIRLMSRTFYHPDIRRKNLRYEYHNTQAPVMVMLKNQIEFVKERNETLIITMEKLSHRKNLDAFFKKCNNLLGHDWSLLPGLYQTTPESWQNLGVYGSKKVLLPSITIEEWKLKYAT